MFGSWRHPLAAFLGTAALAAAAPAAAPAADLEPPALTELETLLHDLGFDPGAVDGVVDDDTIAAIRRYQDFALLSGEPEPSAQLLNELRGVAAAFAALNAGKEEPPTAAPAPAPEIPEPGAGSPQPPSQPQTPEAPETAPIPASDKVIVPPPPPPPKLKPLEDAAEAEVAEEGVAEEGVAEEGVAEEEVAEEEAAAASAPEETQDQVAALPPAAAPAEVPVETPPEAPVETPAEAPAPDSSDEDKPKVPSSAAIRKMLNMEIPDSDPAPPDPAAAGTDPAAPKVPGPETVGKTALTGTPETQPAPPDPEAERQARIEAELAPHRDDLAAGRVTRQALAGQFNDQGRRALQNADYETAVLKFSVAIELVPDFAGAYSNRGTAYQRQEEAELAAADFAKAQQLGFGGFRMRDGKTPFQ